MDPKISGEFSVGADEESEMSTNATTTIQLDKVKEEDNSIKEEKAPSACASNIHSGSSLIQGDETVSKREDSVVNKSSCKADKGRKSAARVKDPSGKRKVKVDWTPELHRQFVEAVEHLGVDKAVPSKILELMAIDCLTRHNVASHLQKYRSHRKHLLAREAEAATWARRRQIYGTTGKRVVNSLVAPPTTGFPPPQFRPLHVWGHPSIDQSLMSTWHSHHPSPPRAWAPPLPGEPSSFWYCHHQDVPAPRMPCFPPSFLPTRFTTPPPPSMYRVAPTIGLPVNPTVQTLPKPPLDSHPSKESIDEVIGDVLTKPWLPLPLGLKPPSIDSVLVELQRQGISKIPPSCA